MNIKKDIKTMVESAYDQAIESEGIYYDFEEFNLSFKVIDKFLDEIKEKTKKKWFKELVKLTIIDFIRDNQSDYVMDDFGNITWRSGSDVRDWHMNFFCQKIVNLYKKKH